MCACVCTRIMCMCMYVCMDVCMDVSTCDCASYEWHNMFANKRCQVQLLSYCRCTGLNVWGHKHDKHFHSNRRNTTNKQCSPTDKTSRSCCHLMQKMLLMDVMDSGIDDISIGLTNSVKSDSLFTLTRSARVAYLSIPRCCVHQLVILSSHISWVMWYWSITCMEFMWQSCDLTITGMLHLLVVEVIFHSIGTQAGRYLGRSLHTVRGVHRRRG